MQLGFDVEIWQNKLEISKDSKKSPSESLRFWVQRLRRTEGHRMHSASSSSDGPIYYTHLEYGVIREIFDS